MRRILLLCLLWPSLAYAQTPDTASDRQLRQRLDWLLSRLDNAIVELQATRNHAQLLRDAVHLRILADSAAPAPQQVPEPEPEPEPPIGDAPDLLDIDFDGYTSTAALLADGQPWNRVEEQNTGRIALDPAVAPPGHSKSMRYHYRHGGDGCGPQTIRRSLRFPRRVQEVWAEFQVRWSDNFRTTNDRCPPNDHKLIFGDTEADESGRWAFYVGADTGPLHTIMVERPMHEPGRFLGAYYLSDSGGLRAADLWDGRWHVIRLYYRNSTTQTSGDGAMRVWIDGVLVHDERGFNTTRPGGGREYLNGFSFAHNKDDGPPGESMYLWWGHVRAWSRDPGW